MCIRSFVTILAVSVLLGLFAGGGCNPDQLRPIDQAFADANAFGSGIGDFVNGPAGAALPPQLRLFLEILGSMGGVGLLIWQQIRGALVKKTGAAIVNGVEKLPDDVKIQVKEAVKAEMKEREIYSKANAVVDQLKAA